MQFSIAQCAAQGFAQFRWATNDVLEGYLGSKLSEKLPVRPINLDYVSDWLHLWLLSGLAHFECANDPLIYTNAVALTYVEYGMHRESFERVEAAPPAPVALIKSTAAREEFTVSSPELPIPMALTPAGFEITRRLTKSDRRSWVLAFVEQPERFRYGFDTSIPHSPYHTPAQE
jgi:hypothetical protein